MQSFKFINLSDKPSRSAQSDSLNDLVKSFFIAPTQKTACPAGNVALPTEKISDLEKKTARSRQKANAELDAAIALYKAGMPCKVRKAVVCAVKGWSRATLYRRIAEGKFPKPLKDDRNSWWWISDVFDDP